jgi:hypothetical protein
MNQNYTPRYLFTVDQIETSLININDFFENIDKELDELLGVSAFFEPKDETVNAILKCCK